MQGGDQDSKWQSNCKCQSNTPGHIVVESEESPLESFLPELNSFYRMRSELSSFLASHGEVDSGSKFLLEDLLRGVERDLLEEYLPGAGILSVRSAANRADFPGRALADV